MKQGVLTPGRVALLMTPGDSCFRGFGRRNGERRRKSVRGCIVSQDLSVLNLAIVKKGEAQILPVFGGWCAHKSQTIDPLLQIPEAHYVDWHDR